MTDKIQEKQNIIIQLRKDKSVSAFEPDANGPPIWLISFTDVIALMLTFFVLLYSMTQPDPQKWEKKVGLTTQAQAQFSGARNFAGRSEGVNLSRLSYNQGENLDYIEAVLSEVMTEGDKFFMALDRTETSVLMVFRDIPVDNPALVNFVNRLTPTLNAMDNQMALIAKGDNLQNFGRLQDVARLFRANQFRKNFVLEMSDAAQLDNVAFIISIQPDDGRRITR